MSVTAAGLNPAKYLGHDAAQAISTEASGCLQSDPELLPQM